MRPTTPPKDFEEPPKFMVERAYTSTFGTIPNNSMTLTSMINQLYLHYYPQMSNYILEENGFKWDAVQILFI